jgi:4'-phosphopantetheinyl transferase
MNSILWPLLTEIPPLENDLVIVVQFGLEVDPITVGSYRAVLSSDELVRADRYKFEEPRRRFVVCRSIVRQVLAAAIGGEASAIEFEYGAHGKPFVRAPDESASSNSQKGALQFSVSHSGNLAMMALCLGRRVGVDLELHDPNVRALKLARRFFSAREAQQLAELPESDVVAGFYRGWTSKEAYLKATGFGLSFPLNQFTVSLDPHSPPRLISVDDQPDETSCWDVRSLDVGPLATASLFIEASRPSCRLQLVGVGR